MIWGGGTVSEKEGHEERTTRQCGRRPVVVLRPAVLVLASCGACLTSFEICLVATRIDVISPGHRMSQMQCEDDGGMGTKEAG